MPERKRNTALIPLAGIGAMVVCCVGHILLLATGIGGLGTVIAAVTGNPIALAGAAALLGSAVALALIRVGRSRTNPGDRDR